MTLFRNRHRVESTRMRNHDYSSGWYFVTICTEDRICHFGTIQNGFMRLSDIGSIVADEWTKTPIIRPNVELDRWVVMPNHLHGIIHLIENDARPRTGAGNARAYEDDSGEPAKSNVFVETPRRGVSTDEPLKTAGRRTATYTGWQSTAGGDGASSNNRPWKPGCLGSIINQFKSVCTKRIRLAGCVDFSWQPRFHDRIIRDDESLNQMRLYIMNNPTEWTRDRNNPACGIRCSDQ